MNRHTYRINYTMHLSIRKSTNVDFYFPFICMGISYMIFILLFNTVTETVNSHIMRLKAIKLNNTLLTP